MSVITVTILDDDDYACKLGTAVRWGITGFLTGAMNAVQVFCKKLSKCLLIILDGKLGTAVGWDTTGFVNGSMTATSSILREV